MFNIFNKRNLIKFIKIFIKNLHRAYIIIRNKFKYIIAKFKYINL